MLFLLLVYFLTQSNLGSDASPIPLMEQRANVSCNDLNSCRTIWSIIWSCLSTVFLCTWVTLHPNITIAPTPLRGFLKNKLPLFLWALLVPEYILAWAIRQYLRAGEIQRECNVANKRRPLVPEWTRAHGFFVIMGGFHLYTLPDGASSVAYPPELSIPSNYVLPLLRHSHEVGNPQHPLDFDDLSLQTLAYFAPTEREIKDRGKADVIAKSLVLVQTSWFVVQCIARGVKHLPITELEVVTLAYVMMNLFTYYFWRHKPKDVECPVRVYEAGLGTSSKPAASKADQAQSGEKAEWGTGIGGVLSRCLIYVVGGQDDFFRLSEESQVPMFWSGKAGGKGEGRSMLGASVLGMAFGAIHFIAWNSQFPSAIEALLWWTSCVTMVAVPLAITLFSGIWEADPELSEKTWSIVLNILGLLSFAMPLAVFLYFFARIASVVIAFTTLRELPSDAFKAVEWASFIPHI